MTPGVLALVAAFIPLAFVLVCGNPYIRFLKVRMMGQYIREDGPQSHHAKAGTPTAGGVLILAGFLLGFAVLAGVEPHFLSPATLAVAGIALLFGLLGFVDDFLKITKKHNKGVSGYTKLIIQVVSGLGVGWLALHTGNPHGMLDLGGARLGWLYIPFAALVVTGTSNAVNLTDGLDGLASATAVLAWMSLALILTPMHPALALNAHLFTGACLGFLAFNHYPARIFMGDTGSLALGGALGTLAVLGGMPMALLLIGGIYVVETLSVVIQVISFKTTGKRVFRMSPLHHHFELLGWREPTVVYGFVTFQFVCCMAAVFLYNGG